MTPGGPGRPGGWGALRAGLALLAVAAAFSLPSPRAGLWRRPYLANLPMPTRAALLGADRAPHPEFAPTGDGVTVHVDWERPDPASPEIVRALDRVKPRWARIEVPWAAVQPERTSWTWAKTDQLVHTLRKRGCRIVGILGYWSHWAKPYSAQTVRAFGQYAESAARRYAGQIQAWEVWNEPNNETYWQSTPEAYAALLKTAYQGVKRGHAPALVLGGSLSGADTEFLQRLLKTGAEMDALAVHPYTFGWLPEVSRLRDELRGLSTMMARAGRHPGLWVTELGMPGDDPTHAERLARCSLLARQSGVVEQLFWYCLAPPGPPEYSLVRADGTPKAAVAALASAAARGEGAPALGGALPADHSAPWASGSPFTQAPLQAWWMQGRSGPVRVTWTPVGEVQVGATRYRTAPTGTDARPDVEAP